MDDLLKKRWKELAEPPATEQDYEELLRAVAEIILVLEQKISVSAMQEKSKGWIH